MEPKWSAERDFYRFIETLFFDNTAIVLLDFKGPEGSLNRFFDAKTVTILSKNVSLYHGICEFFHE